MVELAIVILILMITVKLAMPRFAKASARYHAENAARRIIADLEYARARARQLGKSVTITFDAVGKTYTITNVASPIRSSVTYKVDLSVEPYLCLINPSSFGVSRAVTFDMFGNASAGGTLTVRCGTYLYTVTLDQTTGRVYFT